MRRLLLSAAALLAGTVVASAQTSLMEWAYPLGRQIPAQGIGKEEVLKVPDSMVTYTGAQVTDRNFAPDWHPEDHDPMPEVVAFGRKADGMLACGYCHRATGPGGPENAQLSGLSYDYFVQQMKDFRSGARAGSFSPPEKRRNIQRMIESAMAMTDEDIAISAAYFTAIPAKRQYTVIETDTIPAIAAAGSLYVHDGTGNTEPLGKRIWDTPEDLHQFESRDARSKFIAYVPTGSIAKGKDIVEGKTGLTPCAVCHGEDLTGLGPYMPPIAGRSPAYQARQLYEFQTGMRAGDWAVMMAPVVAQMSDEDILNVVAYLVTLDP